MLFSVDNVGAGQFVEGRVAVPAGVFTDVSPTGPARLPVILPEEGQLADRANADRAAAARRDAQLQHLRRVANRVFPIVALFGWFGFILIWLRWGREYKTDHDVGEYQREPFDDPPALVPTLFDWGGVPNVAVSATLVDLAQRGYMTIEEVKERAFLHDRTDWKFTVADKASTDLRPFESILIDQLFAEGSPTTEHEFTNWARTHRTEADRWYQRFKAHVRNEFATKKYIEGGKAGAYALNFVVAGAVLAISIFLLSQGVVLGLLGLVSGVAQIAASPLLRRRTHAGRQRLAEWKAFEHFLRDFSQLEEAPVASMVIWERYLVYAVALGVTAEVARALEAHIPRAPDGSMQPGFAPWFIGYHGVGALGSIGGLSDFAHSFGPTIAAAVAPPSSSSSGFGGGGFSGGGGGGGGGGGMGAS